MERVANSVAVMGLRRGLAISLHKFDLARAPLLVDHGSRLQLELMELLRCRAEVAEVVNGRARWREGEGLERFLEHFVEVLPGGEAGGDVRMVILAGSLRNER